MPLVYTDAPPTYDGFGTRTMRIMALIKSATGPRPLRLVEIPDEHADWQRSRYESGGYLYVASAGELIDMRDLLRPLKGECLYCGRSYEPLGHVCPTEGEGQS